VVRQTLRNNGKFLFCSQGQSRYNENRNPLPHRSLLLQFVLATQEAASSSIDEHLAPLNYYMNPFDDRTPSARPSSDGPSLVGPKSSACHVDVHADQKIRADVELGTL
jgi:hypothetical protein